MLDPATKSMLQFGLIGLALGGGLLGALQTRPDTVLPFQGTVSVQIVNPSVEFASSPGPNGCLGDCPVSSLNLTIDSVSVHRSGELNLTAGWLQISQAPTTVDVVNIAGLGQLVGQNSIPPGFINLIRLQVSSATALGPNTNGPRLVSVPSGKIDVVLSPSGQVKSGKLTTIFLSFQPRIECGGNGNGECKLKPVVISKVLEST